MVPGTNLYASVNLEAPKGTKGGDFYARCQASVCGKCGYMEFEVKEAAKLLAAYKAGGKTELPFELRK